MKSGTSRHGSVQIRPLNSRFGTPPTAAPGGLKGRGAVAFTWSPERALSERANGSEDIALSDRERAEGFRGYGIVASTSLPVSN